MVVFTPQESQPGALLTASSPCAWARSPSSWCPPAKSGCDAHAGLAAVLQLLSPCWRSARRVSTRTGWRSGQQQKPRRCFRCRCDDPHHVVGLHALRGGVALWCGGIRVASSDRGQLYTKPISARAEGVPIRKFGTNASLKSQALHEQSRASDRFIHAISGALLGTY